MNSPHAFGLHVANFEIPMSLITSLTRPCTFPAQESPKLWKSEVGQKIMNVTFYIFCYLWITLENCVFFFQANVNAWQASRAAIVKCLVIGVATGSAVRIAAIVSMPTPMGAIQSVESASASRDGKVNSASNNGQHPAHYWAEYGRNPPKIRFINSLNWLGRTYNSLTNF